MNETPDITDRPDTPGTGGTPANRWIALTGGTRGEEYAERFRRLAAEGKDVHGEARFCDALLAPGSAVLDAGCGTGRVGIELARRGHRVTGIDLDASMLAVARADGPDCTWLLGDLAEPVAPAAGAAAFDLAVLAGNVMIFLAEGTEKAVAGHVAACVRPGGLVVAGFSLDGGPGGARLPVEAYDDACAAADLDLVARYAGWDGEEWTGGGDYAVSVHRRRGPSGGGRTLAG